MTNSERAIGILDSVGSGLKKVVDPLSTYLVYIGAVFSLAMALIVVIDVLLRLFFNRPVSGVIELETFMLAVLCFFSLAYTMIKGGHVSVDIFIGRFSDKFRLALRGLFSIFGAYIFTVISWQYVIRTITAVKDGELSQMWAWPVWPFFLITSFGCALIGLVLVINFIRNQSNILKNFVRPWRWTFLMCVIALGVIVAPWLLNTFSIEFEPITVGIFMMVFMLMLLFLGLPVAFTMALVGFLGTWYLVGAETSLGIIRMSVYDSVANYFFTVVPFFVLMGFFCLHAGISKRLYETANKWFGQMPGGLAIGTIAGCGGFSAICGDSMATAATMGSVSLPEMRKYGYDDSLATGSVAAGGTLGILIPPSLGFIVYGIITQESVGKLFMAGIIPGILLTILFSISIYVRCKLNPALGPKAPKTSILEKVISLKDVWAVVVLFGLVIGGIYSGFFTATEAGGVGVIGALIIALTSKSFTWKKFFYALLSSTQITAMVAGILIGVTMLGYFITLTEIPMELAGFISGMHVSRYVMFAIILFLYLVLGMVMNIIPMIMLTLPIIFPTILALGFDPIWFGVIMVIMMEMGQISPPVGINVFVIAGVADNVSMGKIFKGIFPFIIVEILVITILTIFPDVVMVLPDAMDVLPSIGG